MLALLAPVRSAPACMARSSSSLGCTRSGTAFAAPRGTQHSADSMAAAPQTDLTRAGQLAGYRATLQMCWSRGCYDGEAGGPLHMCGLQ